MMRSVQRVCRTGGFGGWVFRHFFPACLLGWFAASLVVSAPAVAAGLGGLTEIPLPQLSSQPSGTLARATLALNPAGWKHAETENFIYHYITSSVATPVSVEAESYYRVITAELGLEAVKGAAKCHVFILEDPTDWKQLLVAGRLDPWTGGLHAQGALFILRDPSYKFKGSGLAHEVTHLVMGRIAPRGLPLWFEEGCAEYVGGKAYASFMRARNYISKPRASEVVKDDYIPIASLLAMQSYPSGERQVTAFYDESHRLVRFLATDAQLFQALTKSMVNGTSFAEAFRSVYGLKYATLDILEKSFRPYAVGEVLGG